MKGKINMNKRIICLAIAIMMLLGSLCACTSSNGDSLLGVVAGVAGTSSEETSSLAEISSQPESSSQPETSSEVSSEEEDEDESSEEEDSNFDVTYPEKNYNTPKKAYVNTQSTGLTMRTNPSSTNYTAIMDIPKGAEISVKGETGNFYFVDYKGKLGWVTASYVKFADDASSTPVSSDASSNSSSQG